MIEDSQVAIGAVAEATGLAVTAIRYYDEIGIIEPASRVGGKRRFGPDTVGRINFIRRAQDVGFSLDEIKLILDDQAGEWHQLVAAKLAELQDRRQRLDTMITLLDEVSRCGCDAVADCPRVWPHDT